MRRVVLYKHGGGFDREVRVGGRIVDGNEREATKNLDGAESAFDPPFGPYNTNTLWLVTGARGFRWNLRGRATRMPRPHYLPGHGRSTTRQLRPLDCHLPQLKGE